MRAELLPALPPRRARRQAVDTTTSHIGVRCVLTSTEITLPDGEKPPSTVTAAATADREPVVLYA
jgi:hypothetical protein